ncbi:TPA: hypothetical protein ACH3X2_010509 [Trebouxia sp. C0005]
MGGDKIYYEALIPVMNLLPLWGQESVMLQLAQQVTALLFYLGELCAEYSLPASMAHNERAGLFGDGLPIALHDKHRFQNLVCVAIMQTMRCTHTQILDQDRNA